MLQQTLFYSNMWWFIFIVQGLIHHWQQRSTASDHHEWFACREVCGWDSPSSSSLPVYWWAWRGLPSWVETWRWHCKFSHDFRMICSGKFSYSWNLKISLLKILKPEDSFLRDNLNNTTQGLTCQYLYSSYHKENFNVLQILKECLSIFKESTLQDDL